MTAEEKLTKSITPKVLEDFYNQKVAPFLGGMPDLVANKISKSDIYSTTEKIVGTWVDGKPLYQKTIVDTMPIYSSGNEVIKKIAVGANVDTFVNINYIAYSGGSYIKDTQAFSINKTMDNFKAVRIFGNTNNASSDKNTICIGLMWNTVSGAPIYITVQYTKTTDSAMPIGVDTDYSTIEKIVGTWIDGKPIYQKTIECTVPTTSTDGTIAEGYTDIGASIDKLVNYKHTDAASLSSSEVSLWAPDITSSRIKGFILFINNNAAASHKNTVDIINTSKNCNGIKLYVTIQYTKV